MNTYLIVFSQKIDRGNRAEWVERVTEVEAPTFSDAATIFRAKYSEADALIEALVPKSLDLRSLADQIDARKEENEEESEES